MEKENTNKSYVKWILILLVIQNIVILVIAGYGFVKARKSFENIENTLMCKRTKDPYKGI